MPVSHEGNRLRDTQNEHQIEEQLERQNGLVFDELVDRIIHCNESFLGLPAGQTSQDASQATPA